MKTLWCVSAIALCSVLLCSVAMGQGIRERYNNPFIDDGAMEQAPWQWTTYDIVESRLEYDEYGKPWLHHFVAKDEARVVQELKNAYKNQTQIGADIYVRGYIFLVQVKHWAFTLAHEGTNTQYVMHVLPGPDGRGANLSLLALERRVQSGEFKRSWFGFSPAGLEPYSANITAY